MTAPTDPAAPQQAPVIGSTTAWVPWLLTVVLFSLVVAMSVGILKSLDGAGWAEAVLSGGTAFGTSIGICLGGIAAVRELKRPR
ncbi:hypothetical protein [Streptomyces sp. NPDC048340]|uniref:hypothetical protein n=1 Tax=Streptomyces sp. NPDC048340 TaxID=3365537 RepID=UPI003720F811